MKAIAGIPLAQLHSDRTEGDASPSQSSAVLGKPVHDVSERSSAYFGVPDSLCDRTGSQPQLPRLGKLVVDFTPEASLATEDLTLDIGDVGFEAVHHSPGFNGGSIVEAGSSSVADIEVGDVVVGQDDVVRAVFELLDVGTDTPPMNIVVRLRGQVDFFVRPVAHSLVRYLAPQLLLAGSVVDLEFGVVGYLVLTHPFLDRRALIPAAGSDLVTSEVDHLVNEHLVDFLQNISHHLVCQVQGRVELPSVGRSIAVERDVLELRASSPGLSMGWRVDLRNHSNSLSEGILDDICHVLLRVSLVVEATVARQLGVRFDFNREAVLVSDVPSLGRSVPMHDIKLVVETAIDGSLDDIHRHEVPRAVDHDTPPRELWPVRYVHRQGLHEVGIVLVLLEQLREGFESSEEPGEVGCTQRPISVRGGIEGIVFVSCQWRQQTGIQHCDGQRNVEDIPAERCLDWLSLLALECLDEVEIDVVHQIDWHRRNLIIDAARIYREAIGSLHEIVRLRPEQRSEGTGYSEQCQQQHSAEFGHIRRLFICQGILKGMAAPGQSTTQAQQFRFPMSETCQYDEYQMPPNWIVAEDHAKAARGGVPPHTAFENQGKSFQTDLICPCCFKYIEKQPIAYCEDAKDLAFLGVGFPLFYNFMRMCLLLLASLMVDSCVMSIVMNLHQNKCSTPSEEDVVVKCNRDILLMLSYINPETPNIYRSTMKILAFCVSLFVIMYVRKEQAHVANYLEERNTLISQFTFILEGIPRGSAHNQELIRRLVEDLNGERQMEVVEVLLIQDLNEYLSKKSSIDLLMKAKKKLYEKSVPKAADLNKVNDIYKKKLKELDEIRQKMTNQQDKYFIGMAIVKMNTEMERLEAMKLINKLPDQYVRKYFNNYNPKEGRIRAREAPPPTDIIWENIHYSSSRRALSLLVGWIVSICVLAVITVAVFFIIRKKSELIDVSHTEEDEALSHQDFVTGELLSYLSVVLISFFNKFIMSTIFHHICNHQKHQSYSDLQFSFALKYMLGMFFTTALMTLMVEAIIFHNYSDHGVVYEEIIMAVFNAFFSPLVYLINPEYIMRWIRVKLNYGRKDMTQQEANSLMQYPDYDLGKRYAEVMKVMWFTMLYTWLVPIAPIISFFGLALYYLVDKFVLLRRCSVKQSISINLSRKIFKLLEISLLLQPAGQILFDLQLRQYLSVSSIAMFGVALMYLLLPVDKLLDCFFHEKFIPEKLTFTQAKTQFEHFYTSCYPIRRREALRNIIEGVKGTTRHRAIKSYTLRHAMSDDRTAEDGNCTIVPFESSKHLPQPKLKRIHSQSPVLESTIVKHY